jgi:hypothetical protein
MISQSFSDSDIAALRAAEPDGLTGDECRQIAAHVAALFPFSLTPRQLDTALGPFTYGMAAASAATARCRVFYELPERLQSSFNTALVRVGHERYVTAEMAARNAANGGAV